MAGVKANWHLAALELPDEPDDPFQLQVAGRVIDLTAEEPRLLADLQYLTGKERRLADDDGITCDLKSAGQDCRSCVEYTQDEGDELRFLCRVGRRQEDTAEALETLQVARESALEAAERCGLLSAIEHAEGAGLDALVELAEAMA